MTIGVTGASGQLGRLAVEKAKARGANDIVALVRSPEKVADLGVETRAIDYRQPETLAPALDGIDTLVLISSSDFDGRAQQHRNVIEAAVKAGVKRIVYTSILKGDASPMAIAEDHKATEEALQSSGLVTTVLRNGWYVENWTAGLPGALQAGALVGAAGDGKLTPATRSDFAEAIAVVATTEGHDGKVYELAGDEAFTLSDLAAELSRQSGKDVPFNNLSEVEYAGLLGRLGLPDPVATILADADARAGEGALFDDSRTLSQLIGRPTGTLKDAVAAAI